MAFGHVFFFSKQKTANGRRSSDWSSDVCSADIYAEHAGAVPLALADDAVVGDRGRVGAGERAGQAEAGHFAAVGQARQVMVLLLLRAVVHQQFARDRKSTRLNSSH